MGGVKFTAAFIALLMGAGFDSLCAQEQAPVVALKQPISVVGYSCKCKSCNAGLPCGGKPCVQPAVVPSCLGKVGSLSADTCDDSTGYLATITDCAAGIGAGCDADPSCGASSGCDAAPSCGMSSPNCELSGAGVGGCSSQKHDWIGSLWSKHHHTGCRKCGQLGRSNCACSDLCRQQGYWLRAEALMWWTPSHSVPTLATSSPLGTPIEDAGVLGLATTTPLSSDSLFGDMRGGGRVRYGKWATRGLGFESSAWILGNDRDQQAWQSNGNPAVARPFTNVDPLVPGPDSQIIGFDGVLAGTLTINSSSEIYGGDTGIRKNLLCHSNACTGSSYRVDGYAGYRHFRVREGLRMTENLESIALVGPTVLGTTIDLYDDFQTRNEFHGGNVGMVFMGQHNRWTSEIVSRVAFGNLDREVRIDGRNTVTVPNLAPVTRPGGLLAQPTNIGVYEDSDFAILPEFQFNLGYAMTNRTKLTVGYTFMYLGDLVRPGDAIDTNVNGLQLDPNLPLVGPTSPTFAWNDSEMWLMGLTVGAEISF